MPQKQVIRKKSSPDGNAAEGTVDGEKLTETKSMPAKIKKSKKSLKRVKRKTAASNIKIAAPRKHDVETLLTITRRHPLNTMGVPDVSHGYLTYAQIVRYMQFVASKFPTYVQMHLIGHSCEHREIYAMEIDFNCPKNLAALRRKNSKLFYAMGERRERVLDGSAAKDRNIIFIEGGTHAREWITISVALHCIYQLTEHATSNIDLLRKVRFFIVPLVNPDGYEYSITKNRRWRKNRHVHSSKHVGTDCNRNYNFHWENGVSRMGSPTYKGETPFSEPETRALRNILVQLSDQILFLLSLHSYGQSLLYPWGYKHELPSKCRDLQMLASAGQAAVRAHKGRIYRTGSIANTFQRCIPGSIVDYAYGELGIPLALVMELPAKEYGFQPAVALISPICRESFLGIYQMGRCAIAIACRKGLFYSEVKHVAKLNRGSSSASVTLRAAQQGLKETSSVASVPDAAARTRSATNRRLTKPFHIVTLQNKKLTADEVAILRKSSATKLPQSSDSVVETQSVVTPSSSELSTQLEDSQVVRDIVSEASNKAAAAITSAATQRANKIVINAVPWPEQFRGMPVKPQVHKFPPLAGNRIMQMAQEMHKARLKREPLKSNAQLQMPKVNSSKLPKQAPRSTPIRSSDRENSTMDLKVLQDNEVVRQEGGEEYLGQNDVKDKIDHETLEQQKNDFERSQRETSDLELQYELSSYNSRLRDRNRVQISEIISDKDENDSAVLNVEPCTKSEPTTQFEFELHNFLLPNMRFSYTTHHDEPSSHNLDSRNFMQRTPISEVKPLRFLRRQLEQLKQYNYRLQNLDLAKRGKIVVNNSKS